jgi:hypothetical protein
MVDGTLNTSRAGKFREETQLTPHPIAEILQIQRFNCTIEKIILLWLLRLVSLIISNYV